jgi:competence protein ComFB
VPVTIINHHDLDELKNKNEVKVWRAIELYLADHTDVCRCRDCILDAAALTLNSIPAKYHVYSFHSNAPEEKEPGPEIIEAVVRAFEQVTRRPHH